MQAMHVRLVTHLAAGVTAAFEVVPCCSSDEWCRGMH